MSFYRNSDYNQIRFGPQITPTVKLLLMINTAIFLIQSIAHSKFFHSNAIENIFALHIPVNLLFLFQVITYSFLHAGFLHILFNMLTLWMFGSQIEEHWGKRNFIVLYLFSCFLGGSISALHHATALPPGYSISVVGASGGVYGLLLAYAFLWPNREIIFMIFPMKVKYVVMILMAIIFFSQLDQRGGWGQIDHFCHLGGAIAGILFFFGRTRYGINFEGRLSPSYLIQKWKMKKYQEEMYKRQNARDRVDDILDKISKHGMKSLTRKEKQYLKEASNYYEEN